jgi:hypothetical protein
MVPEMQRERWPQPGGSKPRRGREKNKRKTQSPFWCIYFSSGGESMKGSSSTDRESILLALRQELEAARKRAEIASSHFDEALTNVPSGIPYPDSTRRIQKASREYAEAQRSALAALMRLNDFLIHGTIPPGLVVTMDTDKSGGKLSPVTK